MYKRMCSILGLVLVASMGVAQGGWITQISGTNALLMDVYFTDTQTGWAVGVTNTILHTTDGGTNWIAQSPPPSVNYYSVHFTDNQTGCAVGATVGGSGRIRHTTDGGNTWDIITPPSDAYSLWSIYFIDANNGWIAGGREEGFGIDPVLTIHRTFDGGYTWNTQLYQYDSLPLHSVHFADSNNGCAVGEHGKIFWTTDGGSNWIQQSSPTVHHLWGVHLIDANTAWAVGVQGMLLHTTDAGNNWNVENAGTTHGFTGILFVDSNNGWIAGGDANEGIILHTSDAGNIWNLQDTNTPNFLADVSCTDTDTGWAVGNIGTIIHTTDGGAGIQKERNPAELPANPNVKKISPNPFNSVTILNVTGSADNYKGNLNIYDSNGRLMRSVKLTTNTYQLGADLVPGIYFIKLNGKPAGKVVKVR